MGSGCVKTAPTPIDTLVIGVKSLDSTHSTASKLSTLTHNGLLRLDDHLAIDLDLAESFEFKPPLTYRFRLKKGVRFHNGQELTAEDVKQTLASQPLIEKIDAVTAVEPLIVEIRLKAADASFLSELTTKIVPAGGDVTIGTGPFMMESTKSNTQITFKRNENYFATPVKLARLVFRVIPDDHLRAMELKRGKIDLLLNQIPPFLAKSLRNDSHLRFVSGGGGTITALLMNSTKGPLSHREVRQAILYALDLATLGEYRMAGIAHPMTAFLPDFHWAYEPNVKYPYDAAKARAILTHVGYPDPDEGGPRARFQLTFQTLNDRNGTGLAYLVARYLKDVGIEIKVRPMDQETFDNNLNTGRFELSPLIWEARPEMEALPQGMDRGGYRNPMLDQLLSGGHKEMDRPQRKEIYSLVQKTLAEDIPIIPLWSENNFVLFSHRVKGVRVATDGSLGWMAEVYKE